MMDIELRIGARDTSSLAQDLDAQGWALLPNLLSLDECRSVALLYERSECFRSRIDMARHGFGRGEYRYFAYPLPSGITQLRNALYRLLAPVANRWHERMNIEARFPADHATYLESCHRAGQTRPTPLLLRYGEGDFNCLHRDLYGEHVFPLQATVLLSDPQADFTGGEFVLTEQRPRMQSRVEVVPLGQGDAVIFPVNLRPRAGGKGDYRVTMRHGVSTVRRGRRHALGIIFHDAA